MMAANLTGGQYVQEAKIATYVDDMKTTPRQNMQRKIKSMRDEIARLEQLELSMEQTGLLDIPIRQLQSALQF